MRRRAVAVVALTLAVATAVAGVALAVSAGASRTTTAGPAASASPSSAPVTADDYCYVEAMIYYRVKEQELAQTLLRKDGVDPDVEDFAREVAGTDAAELDDLREWYVSWAGARPAEPPTDGPCGGHGADHAQMPGMPTWSALQGFVDAAPPDAEARFAGIVRAQNAGMTALVGLILAGDPNPAVAESAERVLARAAEEAAQLDELIPPAP